MFRKRIHQGADLFESVGYLFGRELFVRKRKLAHLGRVKDRVFQGWYGSDAWEGGAGLPALDGGTDGELADLFPRPDTIIHVRGNQRRNGANQGAQQRRNFWGY
ncbi:hypothetical protein [Thauera aromatica]|uniref:hypothetical protein n=1 Tax=Thauera aromatica TaxID=59405 RepID=UPI001FFCA9FD|nr:hypothetical protein [Thauera aromatica]MCK2097541.1 hypothetical protein [Thauera aromatica]